MAATPSPMSAKVAGSGLSVPTAFIMNCSCEPCAPLLLEVRPENRMVPAINQLPPLAAVLKINGDASDCVCPGPAAERETPRLAGRDPLRTRTPGARLRFSRLMLVASGRADAETKKLEAGSVQVAGTARGPAGLV